MTPSHTLTKLLLCAGLMGVASASALAAGAGASVINRCVDPQGAVLLTDAACPQGSRVVEMAAAATDGANNGISDSGADGIIINTGVERLSPAAQPSGDLPRSRWADLPRPLVRKAAGLDALTLQAARSSLQMQDEVRRQGRMASR
nr:DUF4124 domain-containing protein [uncultured Duganella sp.]